MIFSKNTRGLFSFRMKLSIYIIKFNIVILSGIKDGWIGMHYLEAICWHVSVTTYITRFRFLFHFHLAFYFNVPCFFLLHTLIVLYFLNFLKTFIPAKNCIHLYVIIYVPSTLLRFSFKCSFTYCNASPQLLSPANYFVILKILLTKSSTKTLWWPLLDI